ncbi:hypothetical protein KAR91_81795 [Candidatus Pacearchaeota archaeon]|nr:hypothetical protein [Candidatus Pacearchaeota archaeon]
MVETIDQGVAGHAQAVANKHGIPYDLAYKMTEKLWAEAKRLIFKEVTETEWKVLDTQQKAMICAEVIKQLMDKKNIMNLMNKG